MLGDAQVFLIEGGYTCQVSYCIYSVAFSISSCIKFARDVILQVSYFQIAQYHYPELFRFLRLNSDFPHTSLDAVMFQAAFLGMIAIFTSHELNIRNREN